MKDLTMRLSKITWKNPIRDFKEMGEARVQLFHTPEVYFIQNLVRNYKTCKDPLTWKIIYKDDVYA